MSNYYWRQLPDTTLCNHAVVTSGGVDRIDIKDYPALALRETLLNALVNRDYVFIGSITINKFDD